MTPLEIRIKWMKLIGMDDKEISEHNINFPPTNIVFEQDQLDAAKEIGKINKRISPLSDFIKKLGW